MSSVVVGMFDTRAAASAAHGKLLSAGFAADAMSMTGADAGVDEGSVQGSVAGKPQAEGAIAKFFEHLFGSEQDDDAEQAGHKSSYAAAFDRGSYGLTVHADSDSDLDRAEAILNDAGAVDVDERSDAGHGESLAATATAPASLVQAGTTQKLQEVREELQVGKRAVSRGGVRVFTRVTETPVEESVTLREERADIKRTVVDRPATAADLSAFKEGSFEVREMGEEAVVSKTARVTGEVEVGKTSTERQETVRDTLRETRVEVEKTADNVGTTGLKP